MAKTRAIVKRRKAVRNIRKITRTMELIATARFKKAMDRAVKADAYTRKVGELVGDLSRSGAAAKHPLLENRAETKNSLLLVLTSNRGLCGGYNGNVLRLANQAITDLSATSKLSIEISGKRGIAAMKFKGVVPAASFQEFEDKPAFDRVEEIAERYIASYIKGEIDRLDVAYTQFISMGKQIATLATLLPMGNLAASSTATAGKGEVDYEFMPSASDILAEIVPASFKAKLFKCFLDAGVSEQIARMVAMKGATENAGDLIKSLTRKYNRARQAQITSEIAEIIGTVEALK